MNAGLNLQQWTSGEMHCNRGVVSAHIRVTARAAASVFLPCRMPFSDV